MRKAAVILGLFLIILPACQRDVKPELLKPDPLSGTSPGVRLSAYTGDLTSNLMEGRRAGSVGEARTALYLARYMQQQGLTPAGTDGTYFQVFPLENYEPVLIENRMTFRNTGGAATRTGENLLGLLHGRKFSPDQDEQMILVCAHYDHLGIIGNRLYPGANDNASGVAAVMELINELKQTKPRVGVLFAFFSGEEMGLLGSVYFVDYPTVPLENIACVINLDSLGLLSDDKTLMGWPGPENETAAKILESLARSGWKINWEKTDRHTSDHLSFARKNIAGFTLFSPRWLEQNHTPRDMAGMLKITPLADLITTLAITTAEL